MLNELNMGLTKFQKNWEKLLEGRENRGFFERLRPTAVAWKTEDAADFDARFAELRDRADQIHLGWVNERWLATFHLRDVTLFLGLIVVKLMQRRPGSTDPTGLDHVDFYIEPEGAPEGVDAKTILAGEPALEWNEEPNGDHCKWISVWFEGTEAKLRSDTVLDVCAEGLQAARDQILAGGQ